MQRRGRSEGTSFCLPGEQLHIGIALDQHEAAPVPKQRGQRGVRDPALHGAVAPIAAGSVQVLGDRSGRGVRTEVTPCSPKPGGKEWIATSLLGAIWERGGG